MNNLDLKLAPKSGYCLAFLDEGNIIFDVYKINANVIACRKNGPIDLCNITRLHLFDNDKEFRAIESTYDKSDIVTVLTAQEEEKINPLYLKEQQIYLDKMFRLKRKEKIIVINRFNFNDDNCIFLENYRLAGLV